MATGGRRKASCSRRPPGAPRCPAISAPTRPSSTDPDGEGQFGHAAFSYPPSARLWALRLLPPAAGIRIRLCLADPGAAADPALAERVWNLIERARPAGVPLQLMVEGRIVKESTS